MIKKYIFLKHRYAFRKYKRMLYPSSTPSKDGKDGKKARSPVANGKEKTKNGDIKRVQSNGMTRNNSSSNALYRRLKNAH